MKLRIAVLLMVLAVPACSKTPVLSKEAEYHALALYNKAALTQVDVNNAQQRFNEAAKDYNDFVAKTLEDGKFPKGTKLQPDVVGNKMTVILPEEPKKDDKKQSEKK